MDVDNESVVFVESIIEETTSCNEDIQNTHCNETNQFETEITINRTAEKHGAVWTSNATSTLLKLYESKLEMLETPKRKKRIWLAISESLKDHNIDMTPDQVRWKINALTKKYKRCVDSGNNEKFKYFKDMDNIYSKYNIDGYRYTVSEILDRKKDIHTNIPSSSIKSESKAVIELRKIRLATRIESERLQTKIHIERQWLEYLERQEQMRMQRDENIDRSLKLKEQEVELYKRELEINQSLDLRNIQLQEEDLGNYVLLEKEKCDLLKQLFSYIILFFIHYFVPLANIKLAI